MYKKTTFWGKEVRYTIHMVFATAKKAIEPRFNNAQTVAWVYVTILAIMVVGQLFAFEDFVPLMASYVVPINYGMSTFVACLIALTEVFALPFLLRMPLSPLMRWFSLVCGILAPAIWVKLGLFAVFGHTALTNSGMFGTKVSIHSGWLQLIVSLLLLGLAAWSAYGLWPVRKK
ncbi:MAG: rane protein of unknown function [Candidatus Saccharibacteria bacterium]|nr:rane protein of unknown function [Candidatus Saccharibacteria bacterium]